MPPPLSSILAQIDLTAIVDIGITALLIYWLFSLIRGTRAVRLVIGVSVLVVVYALAVAFNLRLLTQILQAGAVVGLFALVVIFQPELRRALERIGRVGSFGWLLTPAESRTVTHISTEVARAAAELSAVGQGALIVLERETGLEEVAETGVMIHGDVSADLLGTIFTPKSPLHDGAVIIREGRIVAAGALLPLAEMSIHTERFGTRHRAALGITEQTDAVVVVVSEENGQISLVERARIVRNLTETGLARAIQTLLDPAGGRRGAFGWRSASQARSLAGRSPRLRDLGRLVRRPTGSGETAAAVAGPAATAGTVPAGSPPVQPAPVASTTTGPGGPTNPAQPAAAAAPPVKDQAHTAATDEVVATPRAARARR
jgi:diadenylate cyclase